MSSIYVRDIEIGVGNYEYKNKIYHNLLSKEIVMKTGSGNQEPVYELVFENDNIRLIDWQEKLIIKK